MILLYDVISAVAANIFRRSERYFQVCALSLKATKAFIDGEI